MKIELLHYTPIEPLIKATAMPYQSKETKGLVKRVFENGHRSIVRHGMASFLITDVSQSLLRQISRHPHLNLTVKSSRYCDMGDTNVYIPENNLNKLNNSYENILDEYTFDMEKIMDIYKKWKFYEGNQKEVDVAKMFLPLASTTDLVMSGNYQALYEFLQLRNCVRAEGEIRELSLEITKIMKEIVPEIFGKLGCHGDELKMCREYNACGKYSKKEE
jgi:thymidylate synthase (FAD)